MDLTDPSLAQVRLHDGVGPVRGGCDVGPLQGGEDRARRGGPAYMVGKFGGEIAFGDLLDSDAHASVLVVLHFEGGQPIYNPRFIVATYYEFPPTSAAPIGLNLRRPSTPSPAPRHDAVDRTDTTRMARGRRPATRSRTAVYPPS